MKGNTIKVVVGLLVLLLLAVPLFGACAAEEEPSAEFTVSNLVAFPDEVATGEIVTITVNVTNTSDVKDSYTVELRINGAVEDTKSVTVAGGETERVSLSITKDTAGSYSVEVDGQTTTFNVLKTILVGACQDFSGPTAQASGRLWTLAKEFFKWANETGYVPGIRVEWTEVDDRYEAAQVPLAYRELKAKNPDVIFTMTAVSSAGLKTLVDRDKIPVLSFTGSVATAQEPVGYVFQETFVPEINFNCFLNYVADTWTEDRPCKVASLSWDDNDGTQHIESGIATANALGIDFKREYAEVAPPGTGLGAGPFTPYVTRLKELDPDYIFFPMIGPATGVALNEMIAMGMDPKKAVYIVMSAGGMYQELTQVLGGEEPTYGATLVMADYAYSDPLITDDQERLRAFMEPTEYGWDAKYHVNALSYYTSCMLLYEALRIAIEDVGLANIDSEAIYNALQKIKDFDTGVSLPATFGANDRLANQSCYIYEIGTDGIPHLKTDKVYNWPQKWPDVY